MPKISYFEFGILAVGQLAIGRSTFEDSAVGDSGAYPVRFMRGYFPFGVCSTLWGRMGGNGLRGHLLRYCFVGGVFCIFESNLFFKAKYVPQSLGGEGDVVGWGGYIIPPLKTLLF